jgi:pyridoxamine 5'-phosphate oxidase
VSAGASHQSEVVDDEELATRVAEIEARFANEDPPLPPFWGGYRVGVEALELWQGRPDRLHDRVRYGRDPGGAWARERLAP